MAEKKGSTKKVKKSNQQIDKGERKSHLRLANSHPRAQNPPEGESFTAASLAGIKALRQSGVTLDEVEETLMNFMEAAYSGQTDAIPALMAKLAEAQANAGDNNSELEWELFSAVDDGNIEKTRQLIAVGVNVNARDDLGNTPLHIAVERNFVSTVYWLLQAGANPRIEDDLDKTPLQLAQEARARYDEIIKMLSEKK
jgi:ankyrin repeat protein